MRYLYHIVRTGMDGNVLYPLNHLQKKNPGAYGVHLRKYQNREYLLKETIQPLKCLWNDVLHLTAIHPDKINKALSEVGAPIINTGFYQIKPKLLDMEV